ncbi:D-aminopeptidase [Anaerovirgula multivorans]|uniref:D-aminopeptidase n=1 Tax=Anaerovirgula multivorans TaxID=312168 RepID=A0A239A733_9FIRM|nr:P1 family peptidase [Anaerovirgula multivorans]SNR91445.1 D-aminopeptidase [Anaerovirgula multivorans]
MNNKKRIEDYGVTIGKFSKGKLNKITDVKGVKVGHCTIDTQENKTGVTVILPQEGNVFQNKLIAASYVINGFGKTTGLMQIEELGTLETPIALTNTLNIGIVHDAMVSYMIEQCEKDHIEIQSINPVVGECNDAGLNNIKKRVIQKEHVYEAIKNSCVNFEEGDVGAGKGMTCHKLKGGIGSSSRKILLDNKEYHLGILVQSNHGLLEDLTISGKNIGKEIAKRIKVEGTIDKGSIIIVVATDIPLSSRQLKRVCKRASVGLARVGSYIGHGSGEVVIGFTTGNIIEHDDKSDLVTIRIINENHMDLLFRAVAEACEEAILNSMITANSVVGYKGNRREALRDFIKGLMDV